MAEKEAAVVEKEVIAEAVVEAVKKINVKIRREEDSAWIPRTDLGRSVKEGKIISIEQIWEMGKVIKEPEIVDFFVKDLDEKVLKIGRGQKPFKWMQRMTDSGRRNKYFVMVAVGNKNGFVGLGIGRGKEYGVAIASGLRNAKLSLVKIDRGCGSWDCGCGATHSIPVGVVGKSGSVSLYLKPAPKGTGIVTSVTSRDIIELAGIKDVWSSTQGHTKTRTNFAKASFNALVNLSRVKK